ncbi:MAG TPA: hypothetical protein VIV11_32405 [Kofleriaceae bacterium]
MTKPDPELLRDVVSEKVLAAWRAASEALVRAGIRHVVVGGLAVGANGYPRATKDVDFLVGDDAFVHHPGGLVTMNPALPIEVNGVAIDYLSAREGEQHLAAALAEPPGTFVDAPRLVYMKLRAARLRDRSDVAGLVNSGADVEACRAYLSAHAPDLVDAFEDLVRRAAAEE